MRSKNRLQWRISGNIDKVTLPDIMILALLERTVVEEYSYIYERRCWAIYIKICSLKMLYHLLGEKWTEKMI